jgi:alpha-beta hydrolase superfamily lysophospholipase
MTDAETILDKGIELSKRDGLPLVILGRSLGGAVSIRTFSIPKYRYLAKGIIL